MARGPGTRAPKARLFCHADLFVPPGTPVLAPLDGRVASVADNAGEGDYGPTVILEHRAGPDGDVFYTLYGHLARASVQSLGEGQPVMRGMPIAAVGAPPENGGWPPHLHFQIITDINSQGTTVLLVEQNALMALNVAHRGYVLQTGRIILADTAAALTANPQVRQAYLGEI